MVILAEDYCSGDMNLLITLNNLFMPMTHKFTSPPLFCSTAYLTSPPDVLGHIRLNISQAEFSMTLAELLLLFSSFPSQSMVPGTWRVLDVMFSPHRRGSVREYMDRFCLPVKTAFMDEEWI